MLESGENYTKEQRIKILKGIQEDSDWLMRMVENLLSQKELPDAIICANNYIALGCVDAAAKKGLRIPKDIGIMAFDNFPFSQIIEPPLTVVDINVRDMGAQAAKFLTDIMRHPNTQIQTYITTSNVIVRGSTR